MKPQDKSSKTPRTLVVEDEQSMRDLLKLMMADWGYKPLEASNIKDALAHIALWNVDLMLLDLHLRGADGRCLHWWYLPLLLLAPLRNW